MAKTTGIAGYVADRVAGASDAELEEARLQIEAELALRREGREREEAERLAAEEAHRKRLEEAARTRVGEWVEYERINCGKDGCKVCGGSRYAHGPYWFHYFTGRSGYTSRYVGPRLDARAKDVLEAHREKARAKSKLGRGAWRGASGDLEGKFPEEVYPDEFTAAEREKVRERRERAERRDAAKATEEARERAEDAAALPEPTG